MHYTSLIRWLTASAACAAVACTQPATAGNPGPSPRSSRPAATPSAPVAPMTQAVANMMDIAGHRVGTLTLTDSYAGLIVSGNLANLGLGAHAIHFHAVGTCVVPFTSAGGHFNPGMKQHGYLNPQGSHLGDLPNIDTPAAGTLRFDMLVTGVTLTGANRLLDADGASVVVHAARDDYTTDPSGDSGGRIACGVIRLK